MKRWFACLMTAALLLSLLGCAKDAPPPQKPVNFYYPATDTVYDGKTEILHAEVRESANFDGDIPELLNLYLQGPVSESLRSPFPRQITVTRYASTANTAIVELSNEFSHLVGIDLTVACACIARTLFDLTDLDRVQLSATDAQLEGQAYLSWERDDIHYMDTPDPTAESSESTTGK